MSIYPAWANARNPILSFVSFGVVSCAGASSQIATALTGYGLDAGQSRCVGDDLQAHLSIHQLKELGRVARNYTANNPDPARFTVRDLVRVSGRFDDPRIPLEVGKAAASCGVLADALLPAPR